MHLTKLSPTSSSGFRYYMFYFHDKAIPINEICEEIGNSQIIC